MAANSVGTLLKIGSVAIAEVLTIDDIGLEGGTIETTNLSSTSKSFIGSGVVDAGEISASGFFVPSDTTGQKAVWDLLSTQVVTAFSVVYASLGTDFTFNAIVTKFKVGAAVEEGIPFEITLRVTGTIALGISASTGLSALSLTGTGGSLSPAFAETTRNYTFGGVSATSVTVTATAASHTIQLYVDGVFVSNLASGSASAAIPLTINVGKKITLIYFEEGKAQKTTEIIVVKTS